ncbi:hypothetical protein FRC08_005757, partial [Ceratobasidium sp. 394]
MFHSERTSRYSKKKCDETRPRCQRCKRAGMECLGYSYLDHPVSRPRKRRLEPGAHVSPAHASEHTGVSFEQATNVASDLDYSNSTWPFTLDVLSPDVLASGETWPSLPLDSHETYFNPGIPSAGDNASSLSGSLSTTYFGTQRSVSGSDFGASSLQHEMPALTNGILVARQMASAPADEHSTHLNSGVINGFRGYYHSEATSPIAQSATSLTLIPSNFQESVDPLSIDETDDNSSTASEDSDTEGVLGIILPTLTLDRDVASNSLPFILSSSMLLIFRPSKHLYMILTDFRWMIRTVFEPLKLAQLKKNHIIQRYMQSEESRSGAKLVATIMHSLLKDPQLAASHFPALATLESRVNYKLGSLNSSQQSLPVIRTHDVLIDGLHEMHELIYLRSLSSHLIDTIKLLRAAVPFYRQACSKPPGVPIHLPTNILHPESLLRHFPVLDIMLSLGTGQPMLFRYDLTPIAGLSEGELGFDNIGLQPLHGIPDCFLLVLARMNMLREDFAPNIDPRTIRELEAEIRGFTPVLGTSVDPYLMVARLMVQESWRQTLYIYLYMGLCGADTRDPRVERALGAFIRVLQGVKPGPTPDSFLLLPMITAGVAARKTRHRDILRQRIL